MRKSDFITQIAENLTLTDIRVLWFDVFDRKMEDDVQDKHVACRELVNRSSRDDMLPKLIDKICRNHPAVSKKFLKAKEGFDG